MGLFSKESCILCNSEVGSFNRTKLNNGNFICSNCVAKTKLTNGWNIDTLKSSNAEQIKERIIYVEKNEMENQNRINKFTPTYKVGGCMWFDDNNKWFIIPKGSISPKIDKSHVFDYSEILNFEVLEDGNSVTKGGLGKAIVGGAIFGLAGAIAGGTSKKTKQICNKLEIKLTTKNIDEPVIYINLINTETKKNGFVYKTASKLVQDILSKFQIILNQQSEDKNLLSHNCNLSVADEIKKYKELLDMGAITQDEFNKKKSELLNI